jgi:hypothetical protein
MRRRIARAAREAVAATAVRYDISTSPLTPNGLAETTKALCASAAWSAAQFDPVAGDILTGIDLTWLGPKARDRHSDLFSVEVTRATRAYFMNSPERLAELDDSVKPWLRLPPRRAKRLYNHARLLYALSLSRDVLGSSVTPSDVGRWAVLSDTWPGAAEVLARFNEDLRELVRNRAISDKEREEGLAALLDSAKLPARELAESKAFMVRLIRAGEFDDFLLVVPELAGLLPYREPD